MHSNTLVRKGQVVAGTRAIPLVVKRNVVERAVTRTADANGCGVISVKELRKPRTGVVITGNEVYHGKIKDAFGAIITQKIRSFGGDIVGMYYAPDDASFIEQRLRELVDAGVDLLITTGGMSVDPDDVTRFAIRRMGVSEYAYGSAVLPGAMILVSYINKSMKENGSGIRNIPISNIERRIPVLGIPACGMYHRTTVFDLILPRILAGEYIGRRELAELGHGGLCLHCDECRYPLCPFGK
jgi:molybdenum cofactor synthesis domain-containing protein